ncbi:MAG: hypothetical protein JO215_09705 [Ktedonobacteraceae bacterium]|nr:hypothetical protein [Ktedonobacteraceae bacterium]
MTKEKADKRNRFDEEVFSYRATKDGKVFLYWHRKQVKILKGPAAQEFLEDIADGDQREAQLVMARVTGNFKRGNERPGQLS